MITIFYLISSTQARTNFNKNPSNPKPANLISMFHTRSHFGTWYYSFWIQIAFWWFPSINAKKERNVQEMVLLTGFFWFLRRQYKVFLSTPLFVSALHFKQWNAGKYLVSCKMQNLPSSRAGYMDEWLSCLLMLLWFIYFSKSCFHSLIVAYQNPLWFQWKLNGAIRLLFIWIFDQGNEIPSMTLNSHFSISEKCLGPNRLASCSGLFFLITS